MTRLVRCDACERHVRISESRCPFCEAQLQPGAARRVATTWQRGTKRAVLFALSAGVATAACGSEDEGAERDQQAAGSTSNSSAGSSPSSTGPTQTTASSTGSEPTGSSPEVAPDDPKDPPNLPAPTQTMVPRPEPGEEPTALPLYGAIPAPVDPAPSMSATGAGGGGGFGGVDAGAGTGGAEPSLGDSGTPTSDDAELDGGASADDFPEVVPLYGALPAPRE